MTGCMKQHPLINQTLLQLEEVFNNHQCKTYNDKFRTGLRFIKLRVFQDKVQVIIITGKDGLKDEVVSDIKKLNKSMVYLCQLILLNIKILKVKVIRRFLEIRKKNLFVMVKNILCLLKQLTRSFRIFEIRNKIVKTMVKGSKKIISN